MTAKKESGPEVVGVVDEANGKVTVAVKHGDVLLPVATASLDYATALNFGAEPADDNGDDNGKEA